MVGFYQAGAVSSGPFGSQTPKRHLAFGISAKSSADTRGAVTKLIGGSHGYTFDSRGALA